MLPPQSRAVHDAVIGDGHRGLAQLPGALQGHVLPGGHESGGLLLLGGLEQKALHPAADGGQQLLGGTAQQQEHPVGRGLLYELEQLVLGGLQGLCAHLQDVHADVRLLRGTVGVGGELLHLLNSKGAGRPAPFHHADIGM